MFSSLTAEVSTRESVPTMVAMLVPDSTAAPAPAVEITVPERSAVISSGIRDIAVDRLAVAAAS